MTIASRARTAVRSAAAASVLVAAVLLAGCSSPSGSAPDAVESGSVLPVLHDYPDVRVLEDVSYGSADARSDVCLPPDDALDGVTGMAEPESSQPRAAVLLVHGGSWRRGDKADPYWRNTCEWLASEGFVVVSANYRLAPEHPYPAAIEDLRRAVGWMRAGPQLAWLDIDPGRIGVFGGSAGGNLAALLALEDEGDLDEGSRVSAAVDLSAPVDLTAASLTLGVPQPAFLQYQLDYLGCADYSRCPSAHAASPLYDVDPTDPPFFVAHSRAERVPHEQSDALVDALREEGVPVEYVRVDGTAHSIAMLDDGLKERVAVWLTAALAG
jgi:acetyl esterase